MPSKKRIIGGGSTGEDTTGRQQQRDGLTKTKEKQFSSFSGLKNLGSTFSKNYLKLTPQRIQLIDLFIVVCLLVTAIQTLYCFIVGSFPFNSFLSGKFQHFTIHHSSLFTFPFIFSGVFSSGGVAIFAVVLRMQLLYPYEFKDIKPERALADFLICCFVLFIGTTTFLG